MENNKERKLMGQDCDQDENILMPYNYISNVLGKSICSKFSKAFNKWLQVPEEILQKIDSIIEILHNTCLLLDDIHDNSVLRSGIPVAHSIYGIPSTMIASNYATLIAMQMCLALNHPEAIHIFNEQLMESHKGQAMEIYWRDNYICPTEVEYCEMAKKSTGGLLMMTIRLMQLFSENKQDFSTCVGIIALFYQIQNDYENMRSESYMTNKTYCEDLTEGKFSFPLIYAINKTGTASEVMHIIKQRTRSKEMKYYCVQLMEKLGSFDYTRETLVKLALDVRNEIQHYGSNEMIDEYLNSVLDSISI